MWTQEEKLLLSTLTSRLRPMFMVASLFALAASAQATVITFGTGGTPGFTGGGSSDGPVNVGGGITLTVTPWSNSFIFDPTLTVDGNGYGVRSGIIDDDQLDGSGWTEAIILTFSSAVQINGVELRNFSGDDDVDLFANGNPWAGGTVVGMVFKIQADDYNSEFRVRSVNFDAVSAVPEPANLLTAGLGLGLLALGRFRRK
jgi:hypothetical protein